MVDLIERGNVLVHSGLGEGVERVHNGLLVLRVVRRGSQAGGKQKESTEQECEGVFHGRYLSPGAVISLGVRARAKIALFLLAAAAGSRANPQALAPKLQAPALKAKGPAYKPRTRH